ncbi:MAG TPA: hypothetical protein VNZ26_20875, partial [Vicinamibacterales bacterium]|nr:hypothetical protein [Vicinamibacterales bacterium]
HGRIRRRVHQLLEERNDRVRSDRNGINVMKGADTNLQAPLKALVTHSARDRHALVGQSGEPEPNNVRGAS